MKHFVDRILDLLANETDLVPCGLIVGGVLAAFVCIGAAVILEVGK